MQNATFKGWYLNDSIYTFSTAIESDLTLTAHWLITDGGMYSTGFENVTLNASGINANDSISGSISSDNLAVSCGWSTSAWGTYGSGFTISSQKDITTAGNTNPYSCIAGSGAYQSETFAVCNGSRDSIKFNTPVNMESVMFCNSTYAYLSMREGDSFAKKFGGADGSDEDYFKLEVMLYDANNTLLGTEDLYLADFRGDAGYIVKDWTALDLSTYNGVSYLKFDYESSDIGNWGMNTPAYFCIDNISYYAAE